jgi:hypothetical protein
MCVVLLIVTHYVCCTYITVLYYICTYVYIC